MSENTPSSNVEHQNASDSGFLIRYIDDELALVEQPGGCTFEEDANASVEHANNDELADNDEHGNGYDSGSYEYTDDSDEDGDDVNYVPHITLGIDDGCLDTEDILGLNFEEFDSGNDSDTVDLRRKLRLKHIRSSNHEDPKEIQLHRFYVGQQFSSPIQVKERVRLHSIETRRDLQLIKNDKVRVRVKCFGLGVDEENKPICPWTLLVSKGKNEENWLVKTLDEEHSCQQKRELRQCTATFLSKQIGDTLVVDPDLKAAAIQEIMSKKYELGIKKMTAYRAKAKAKKVIDGDFRKQYSRLREYCMELQLRNPNTTTRIQVHPEPNCSSDTRVFKRIYICLGPLKQGFRTCQREILGLDGAFLKGPFTGQLLSAVGVDPNNEIYPLAYVVVESESTDSWKWFLECIGDDLNLDSRSNFTFISDRQKGLIPALVRVYPSAEHRFCVRHIYENMRGAYKGGVIKDLVWKCATRTTIAEFDAAMNELKAESLGAYTYLIDIAPHHWSRAHFTGRSKCDMLLNNICEVFNSKLVDGRDKPIITCLEFVREYLMKRIVTVQKVIDKSDGILTPNAKKIFEGIKRAANHYQAFWNGGDRFQVRNAHLEQQIVDVRLRTCTCRKWELNGFPCKHAVACIWDMSLNSQEVGIPEDWVHPFYKLETWKEVYSSKVEPLSGPISWPKSDCPTKLLPPYHKNQIGRPKKKRKKSAFELLQPMVKSGQLSRTGKSKTCSVCGKLGHNSRGCGKDDNGAKNGGKTGGGKTGFGNSGGQTSGASQTGGQSSANAGQSAGNSGVYTGGQSGVNYSQSGASQTGGQSGANAGQSAGNSGVYYGSQTGVNYSQSGASQTGGYCGGQTGGQPWRQFLSQSAGQSRANVGQSACQSGGYYGGQTGGQPWRQFVSQSAGQSGANVGQSAGQSGVYYGGQTGGQQRQKIQVKRKSQNGAGP